MNNSTLASTFAGKKGLMLSKSIPNSRRKFEGPGAQLPRIIRSQFTVLELGTKKMGSILQPHYQPLSTSIQLDQSPALLLCSAQLDQSPALLLCSAQLDQSPALLLCSAQLDQSPALLLCSAQLEQ
jgi:hypothetical protein